MISAYIKPEWTVDVIEVKNDGVNKFIERERPFIILDTVTKGQLPGERIIATGSDITDARAVYAKRMQSRVDTNVSMSKLLNPAGRYVVDGDAMAPMLSPYADEFRVKGGQGTIELALYGFRSANDYGNRSFTVTIAGNPYTFDTETTLYPVDEMGIVGFIQYELLTALELNELVDYEFIMSTYSPVQNARIWSFDYYSAGINETYAVEHIFQQKVETEYLVIAEPA